MPTRNVALLRILQSPSQIWAIVLGVVFAAEVLVMLLLPHIVPRFVGDAGKAIIDAVLLTLICAPALWWIIIGPLQRIAVQERERSKTIVANAGDGILTFDRGGEIVSCNAAASKLFAVDASALVGSSLLDVIPDLPQSFDTFPCDYQLEGVHADGGRDSPSRSRLANCHRRAKRC